MDVTQYTALAAALSTVPDPRCKRGQRYPWPLLLVLVSAAILSGQRHGRAIGQWVREHHDELAQALDRVGHALPSEATLRRTLHALDPQLLDQHVAHLPPPAAPGLVPQALDGKEVRGTRAHGQRTLLVSIVRHDGQVLCQQPVPHDGHERHTAAQVLQHMSLANTVTTLDAGLTSRSLAALIGQQGGQYLMRVKGNQPELLAAISALFAEPPWLPAEQAHEYWRHQTRELGHGRHESRTLEASTALQPWLDWPGAVQVLRRTCRRVQQATGQVDEAVSYAITSLHPREADAAALERLWRGHWTIENRVHHVRDVTFGEDACRAYVGHTVAVMATLHNCLLNLLRVAGWSRIADAVRHFAAHPARALRFIGVPVSGL